MNLEEYATMFSVEDNHWWYHGLRGMVSLALQRHVPAGARLLDAGCGTGATLAMLRGRADTVGIDLMHEALKFCRMRELHALSTASICELPFAAGSFDALISLDVLCHRSIPDKHVPLREFARVVKPGGAVILNLPAYQWLHSSHDIAVHTDRRFTRHEAASLLRDCGLKPVYATYWNTLLFPPILITRLWRKIAPPNGSDLASGGKGLSNSIFRTLLTLERALIRLGPMPFGLSLFIVARKKPTPADGLVDEVDKVDSGPNPLSAPQFQVGSACRALNASLSEHRYSCRK